MEKGRLAFPWGRCYAEKKPYCTRPYFPSTARASWREPRRGNWFFTPYGELYHLEEDPDELYNLYDDPAHAGARGAMVERMMDWYGKTRMQR